MLDKDATVEQIGRALFEELNSTAAKLAFLLDAKLDLERMG